MVQKSAIEREQNAHEYQHPCVRHVRDGRALLHERDAILHEPVENLQKEEGREQRRGVAAGRCEDPRKCIGEEGPAGGGGRRVIRWCIQRRGQQPVSGRPAMAVKEPDPAPCLDHIARTIVKAGGCQLGPPRPLLPEEC